MGDGEIKQLGPVLCVFFPFIFFPLVFLYPPPRSLFLHYLPSLLNLSLML